MRIYTVGFTKKTARTFFGLLGDSGATSLIDVRLNNVSQLAGFAKRDDLSFFLTELCGMHYSHQIALAPTQQMLDDYKKHGLSWAEYESRFRGLMSERQIEESLSPSALDNAVLLCSEDKPHQCHRRVVAEYLQEYWEGVEIVHLGELSSPPKRRATRPAACPPDSVSTWAEDLT
ncbi:DUF488 domain-containing protein [Nocardioides sp. 1609]|uniref:DUF488 domain-containing protein n=1 Tax=Nocardioides sp. 1609 TaxID=2508327 RepID=UPI00106F8D6F|nr:DUF488 domain-containing protein [Nocardioides sp. 1609]